MASDPDGGFSVLEELELPDRYSVRRRIASGGMSSVWCAHDRALGRSVAIKLLCESAAEDEAAIRRFKREARAAARLSGHPHVVTIYDVGEVPRAGGRAACAFIVMEFLPGGTVADALRVGEAGRADVVRWIEQAASAIDYAHAHGVIHRDIKPANFLLDGERKLHVADFGIASLGSEDTLTGQGEMLGTAAYLAPERALGEPATEASDRYSLAVAAYELLAGVRPFTAGHFAQQVRQHVEEDPPPARSRNPTLPRAADPVLARGLAKRPQERWPSATEFAQALRHAIETDPLRRSAPLFAAAPAAARPSAAIPAAARASRARPRRIPAAAQASRARRGALAALLLAVLAVGIGTAAALSRHPTHPRALSEASASLRAPRAAGAHLDPGRARAAQRRASRSRAGSAGSARSASPQSTTQTSTASSPASSAAALQARGHALMVDGEYPAAIALLHEALSSAAPGSLTYAYALFDLGRSLRLSGDPRAAIPILWQRMQIPNQTEVVRQELQLALQAVGSQVRHSTRHVSAHAGSLTGAAPAPRAAPGKPSHGLGPAGDGPPGLGGGAPPGQGVSDSQGD